MAINLIDKIIPKNDGFTGLVDADQVIGGSNLPATVGHTEWDAAYSASHTQGTDTTLGAQTENLDMNTHKIVGVVDPTSDQEVATKKYVDDNAGGSPNYTHVDQSGGTSDTYGVLAGTIDGANTTFTVSEGVYSSGSLTVYLN